MPTPDPDKILSFTKPEDLGHWLELNHATDTELWVKMYKKSSGVPSVAWEDVVVEALRWGWIDGIRKSLDEQAFIQRISPRKARSSWSKRNCEHVERLISEGQMTEAGLAHVTAAKADGRWDNAYAVSEMSVPEDFLAVLEGKPEAKQFFETLTKSSRYIIAHGLISAKKPETRAKRFNKYMDMLGRKEKPS